MHKLTQLTHDINKTHHNLGKTTATILLGVKAKKCTLIVSPSGCGKTVATNAVANIKGVECINIPSLTLAGLGKRVKELTGFTGYLKIDDLATSSSWWVKNDMVAHLADLTHEHHTGKLTETADWTITDFNGSTSINLQPHTLNCIMPYDNWSALVRNKSTRLYHYYRPNPPNLKPLVLNCELGIPIEEVSEEIVETKDYKKCLTLGLIEWDKARAEQHILDYLRAAAGFDGRTKVNATDMKILLELMHPFLIEQELTDAQDVDTGKRINANEFEVITEMMTLGIVPIEQYIVDWKLKAWRVREIINRAGARCFRADRNPVYVFPTPDSMELLQKLGINPKLLKDSLNKWKQMKFNVNIDGTGEPIKDKYLAGTSAAEATTPKEISDIKGEQSKAAVNAISAITKKSYDTKKAADKSKFIIGATTPKESYDTVTSNDSR